MPVDPNDPVFRAWVEDAAHWNGNIARQLRDNRAQMREAIGVLATRYKREGNAQVARDLRLLLEVFELPRDKGQETPP